MPNKNKRNKLIEILKGYIIKGEWWCISVLKNSMLSCNYDISYNHIHYFLSFMRKVNHNIFENVTRRFFKNKIRSLVLWYSIIYQWHPLKSYRQKHSLFDEVLWSFISIQFRQYECNRAAEESVHHTLTFASFDPWISNNCASI